MANELAIPGGDNKAELPAHIAARYKPEESNIIPGDRQASLSIKGKVFTVTAQGETYPLMRDDGEGNEFPLAALPVIILDYGAKMGRSYYATDFNPDEIKEPTCYSLDSVAPEDDSAEKQSDKCATCPMSVKGSKVSDGGKPLTACSPHRILAVVPVKAMHVPPLRLRIAQTSNYDGRSPDLKAKLLFAFQNYLDYIRARGIPHTQAVVTQLSFDPSVAYPKLMFKAQRYVTEEEVAKVDQILEGSEVTDILGRTGTMALKAGVALPPPKNVVALPGPSAETLARRASEATGKANVETAKAVMDDDEAELQRLLREAQARKKAKLEAEQAPKGPTPEEIAAKAAAEKAEAARVLAEQEAEAKKVRLAKLKADLEASIAAETAPVEEEDEEAVLMRQLAEAQARKAAAATKPIEAAVTGTGHAAEPAKRTRRTKAEIEADAAAKQAEIAAKNPEKAAAIAEIPAGEKFIKGAISGNDMGGDEDDGSFAEPTTVASKAMPVDKPKSTAKVTEAVSSSALAISSDVENLLQTWDD